MFISITPQAHLFLKDLPTHNHRKPDRMFNGQTFIEIPHLQNARGISQYLENLLINQTPHIPSHFYSRTKPYYILPESFIDTRPHAYDDYEQAGYPGADPNPTSLIPVMERNPTTIYYNYTTWSNGEQTERHKYTHIDHLVPIFTQICYYWHICVFRPPKTQSEAVGAVLNAIGLGYLTHKYLPPHPTASTDYISDNLQHNPRGAHLYV